MHFTFRNVSVDAGLICIMDKALAEKYGIKVGNKKLWQEISVYSGTHRIKASVAAWQKCSVDQDIDCRNS